MYCSHCGEELGEQDNFCASCGSPVRRHDLTEAISLDGDGDEAVAQATRDDDVVTTIAIDLDGDGDLELLEDLPSLEPGSGLFVIARGPLAGARYVLEDDVTTIGRHPHADLLLDDVTVSRHHAEVRRHGGAMLLVDMGSLNGTYVGSHRVEEHQLAMGDHVQIGRFKLIYVAAGDEANR